MKKKLTNNLGLKIMAVFVALILWYISTNINDPVKTEVYKNIPVTMLNKDYVTGKGKIVELLNDSDSTSVTVKARRSIIDNLHEDDITASIDLKEVDTETDSATTMLAVKCTVGRYSERQLEELKADPEYMKVRVENLISRQITIRTEVTGEPAEGYLVGKVTTDQNMMSVSGPESVVSQITGAKVSLDVAGQNTSINISRPVVLYDADGNEVDSMTLTKSIESVIVNATILETKQVPLYFTPGGEPAEGYALTGIIECKPSSVLVAGRSSYIKGLNRIEVPAEALDVTGLQENLTAAVDLRKYLSEDLTLAGDFDGKVEVTVMIEKLQEKKVQVKASDISFLNVPEGYAAEAADEEEEWEVTVTGLQTVLEGVAEEGITGKIDLAELLAEAEAAESPAGTYRGEIQLELPNGVKAVEPPHMKLTMKETE